MLSLSAAFASAASPRRECLDETVSRRVVLEVKAGKLESASVEADDEVGRCVTSALGCADLGDSTGALEATLSR